MFALESWLEFFERGGYVLWLILIVSCLMWMLILERYWYVTTGAARRHAEVMAQWRSGAPQAPAAREWYRQGLITDFRVELHHHLPMILALTALLPLLGLFGTVGGMIKTFNALTLFGAGNVRGMAAGISQATLPTMAGLTTALSGIYFNNNLQERVISVQHKLESELSQEAASGSEDEEDFDDE